MKTRLRILKLKGFVEFTFSEMYQLTPVGKSRKPNKKNLVITQRLLRKPNPDKNSRTFLEAFINDGEIIIIRVFAAKIASN